MPRPTKFVKQQSQTPQGDFGAAVEQIKAEVALWCDVEKASRLTYERNYKLMQGGWDMGTARKGTRYAMRAAGLYCMRKNLKRLFKEAQHLLKHGESKADSIYERSKLYGKKIAQATKLLHQIQEFKNLQWNNISDKKAHYLQANHKKSPATDAELAIFFEAAKRSSFRDVFLVSEFTGMRPEEFSEGVRMELTKSQDGKNLALHFYIQSAKCDGDKKGLDVRLLEVPHPEKASKEVRQRWMELAHKVKTAGNNGLTLKIDETARQTTGQRITNAFKTTAKAANVDISSYSLRNRYSSQVKQSNPGDSVVVALALGHQTTKTQSHYARANRGKSVSPVAVSAQNVANITIRGASSTSATLAQRFFYNQEKRMLTKIVLPPSASFSPPAPRQFRL